ncbi:hypothetical protein H6A22_10925, partial [Collinsella intestinalis]|nr:hypothetical protein [Collinsella intestinalis]
PDAAYARFNYVWRYEGGWDDWSSTLKETGDYTSDSSWSFTPSKAGDYAIYVDAVRTNGAIETYTLHLSVQEDWNYIGLNVGAASIELGEKVDLSPEIIGPDAAYARFNYVWRYEGGWDDWSSTLKETGDYTSDSS